MRKHFTNRQKAEGEMLVGRLSEKAQKYYVETQPLGVYCNDRNDNDEIYIKDVDGIKKVTFEELQTEFEEMQNLIDQEKKEEMIEAILNSPVCDTPRDILEQMDDTEIEDMYDMLDEYEENYYNDIYGDCL